MKLILFLRITLKVKTQKQCAGKDILILNNFFCAQFCKNYLLEDSSRYTSGSSFYIGVSVDGVIKLLILS